MNDWRIDAIGFVQDLVKKVADAFKPKVKERMAEAGVAEAQGKVFRAKLIPCTVRTIDAGKLLRMYDAEKITRAEFVSCIKVSTEPTVALLSAADLAKISETSDGTPRLVIDRIQKGEPDAQAALVALNDALPGAAPLAAAA